MYTSTTEFQTLHGAQCLQRVKKKCKYRLAEWHTDGQTDLGKQLSAYINITPLTYMYEPLVSCVYLLCQY